MKVDTVNDLLALCTDIINERGDDIPVVFINNLDGSDTEAGEVSYVESLGALVIEVP